MAGSVRCWGFAHVDLTIHSQTGLVNDMPQEIQNSWRLVLGRSLVLAAIVICWFLNVMAIASPLRLILFTLPLNIAYAVVAVVGMLSAFLFRSSVLTVAAILYSLTWIMCHAIEICGPVGY